MVTASPQLTMLALALKDAIWIASHPESKAKDYVPANRDIRRLCGRIMREYNAVCWKADMKASLAPVAGDHYDTSQAAHDRFMCSGYDTKFGGD